MIIFKATCRRAARAVLGVASVLIAVRVVAAGIPGTALEEIEITAARHELVGQPTSASEGTVPGVQLENRPLLRAAEVLEAVPGLIVTQHSGDGKANQYFLRGFNLDHGTDFATFVDGVPVNMPAHAHGQGYSDLNFLIPELIERIEYWKGTYYAELGNFSAAGAAQIRYRQALDGPLLALGGGEDGFVRALAAASPGVAAGTLLLAAAHERTDGPWKLDEDLSKLNVLAKFSRGTSVSGFELAMMGYDGDWRATDQIPQRAVEAGALDRFGFVDDSGGGKSSRYSVSGEAWGAAGAGRWRAAAYAIDYELDLFSNFTYFVDSANGDQFEQLDDRRVLGSEVRYERSLPGPAQGLALETGLQVRHDDIATVGLYRTRARERVGAVREDAVEQTSYGAFVSLDAGWTPWLKSELGLRADAFEFDVESDLAVNSGSVSGAIVSPKLSLVLGPWASTEMFVNAGAGFHSNDARGTTTTTDPNDGVTPAESVDALVRARGAELGLRTVAIPRVQLAVSLWQLELDSELLFVGDGGTTEASRPTKRTGVEIGIFYTPAEGVILDADLAFSRPRFTDDDAAGDRIPGAVERVASLGVTFEHPRGIFGGARVRYLGPASLIEDDSVRSSSTTLLNLEAGYRVSPRLSVTLTVLNALDASANDIAYFYESRLASESQPVADFHVHPIEPRTFRAAAKLSL